jgi:hypothetical protein
MSSSWFLIIGCHGLDDVYLRTGALVTAHVKRLLFPMLILFKRTECLIVLKFAYRCITHLSGIGARRTVIGGEVQIQRLQFMVYIYGFEIRKQSFFSMDRLEHICSHTSTLNTIINTKTAHNSRR